MQERHARGFTLIELLVVIAIIGLLSSIVMVSLSAARVRAQDAAKFSDMREIRTALELYHGANGRYPIAADSLGQAAGVYWSTACTSSKYHANQPEDDCWDGAHAASLASQLGPYLSSIPIPPDNGQTITACNNVGRTSVYVYETNGSGSEYKIYAYFRADPCPSALLNDGGIRNEAYELFSPGGAGFTHAGSRVLAVD